MDFPHNKLLKTKYSVPKVSRSVITRQNLRIKLDRAAACLLTAVVAPVGYGKTAAVLHWLEDRTPRAAWLSLDGDDNAENVFWRYVCAALDCLAPGLSARTEYALASRELMEAGVHLGIILEQLSEVTADCFLILDNFHVIFNGAILEELLYLFTFAPPRLHFIFISRRELPFDLTKWELSGELQRIHAGDLRLRPEELGRFFENRSLTLDESSLAEVASYTDGWVSALVAVALALGEGGDGQKLLKTLDRDHGNIGKYLLDGVLAAYPRLKREFILKTAILNTLSPELCAAVTKTGDAAQILSRMCDQDEFLVQLDGEKRAYRFSPFFRDHTCLLLQNEFGDSVVELHRRAARWYDQNGPLGEAVYHYLKGGEYEEALRLFEPRLGALAGTNAYGTVFPWLKLLPTSYLENCLGMALFYCLYYAGERRFETAKSWLGKARALLAAKAPTHIENPEVPVWLTAFNLVIREGDFEGLACLFESIPPEKRGSYQMEGTFDPNPTDLFFYRSRVNKYIRFIMEQNGPWRSGMGVYRFMSVNAGFSEVVAGEYDYEHNLLEPARVLLLTAARAGEAASCPGSLVPAFAGLARIRAAVNDSGGAISLLDQCGALLKTMNQPHWRHGVDALKHRFLLEAGDTASIESWLSETKLSVFAKIDSVVEYELLVFVRVLLARGQTDEAEQLLNRLFAYAEAEERQHTAVEILNLFALLSLKRQERQNMAWYLQKSLRIGVEEDYFRIYVDEGAPFLAVLEQTVFPEDEASAAMKGLAGKIARQIRRELDKLPRTRGDSEARAIRAALTAKEFEVLALLYNAYSNKEIGQRLHISLRTVKTHTGNIYGKLGVLTRAQCIKAVREAGLFEN